MPRLGCGVADRLHRPVQAAEDFSNGNQLASFALHGLFSHVSQTRQGMVMSCRAGCARPVSLLEPGFVEIPVSIGSFELLVVSCVVERQFAIVVPRRRVPTRR